MMRTVDHGNSIAVLWSVGLVGGSSNGPFLAEHLCWPSKRKAIARRFPRWVTYDRPQDAGSLSIQGSQARHLPRFQAKDQCSPAWHGRESLDGPEVRVAVDDRHFFNDSDSVAPSSFASRTASTSSPLTVPCIFDLISSSPRTQPAPSAGFWPVRVKRRLVERSVDIWVYRRSSSLARACSLRIVMIV